MTYRTDQSYKSYPRRLIVKTKLGKPGQSRFFIRVGKSFIPKAVNRNLLKRRLRAILKKYSKPGADCLVIYNSKMMLSYKELEKEILK